VEERIDPLPPEVPPMADAIRSIRDRIRRFAADDPTEGVHFHQGPQGRPAPCFDARCTSPRLDV
jgi:hypothetical protein